MNVGGQPTKYRDHHPQLLLSMLQQGKPAIEFIVHEKISKQTFNEWVKAHDVFREAYQEGIAAAEAYWTRYGEEHVNDPDFNTNAYMFLMGSRFGVGKTRKVLVDKVAPKKKKTVMEKLEETIQAYVDGEISLEELDKVTTSFNKIADIEEKTDVAKRVEQIAEKLNVEGK